MDYRDVGLVTRGVFDPGKLRLQEDGVHFKSTKTGKTLLVRHVDIVEVEWLRVAKGFEVKLITIDGQIRKIDGFKESDYGELRDFFKSTFRKDLKEVDLCVKGWNWGEAKVTGSLLSFMVDSKRVFEIPLKEVSQVTSGKNEVTLEFHQSEEAAQSLVEMRFHIPASAQAEGEEDRAKVFADLCLAQADVMQATGDAIMSFSEIQTLTPRGRYTIKPYPSFLQLHGKTFDYKIPYDTITRLFLLPHNDQKQMYFVTALDPPIRQGQTRYYFIIFLLPTEEECEVTLTLTEEELQERYGGKLTHHMSGVLYEVFSKIMRALVGKKITVPGSFKNSSNQCAIACSNRATSGYLYPLDKGFIFVHKPAVYIKFEAIVSVNFARMSGSAGISRSFDFELEMKDANVIHFSSIMKEDYNRLYGFVTDKNIRVKNSKGKQVQAVGYNEEDSSGSGHDAYLERMKAEGDNYDSEDEDSDFVAKGSGSDDDLEYDSDAKSSGSEGGEDGEVSEEERVREKPSRKRKKDSAKTARPAKRAKADTGRKKRAKKDPNAPKKPLSAYMIWLQENRPMIKKKYPGATLGEVGKRAGEMWKALGDKSEWDEKAKKARKRYDQVMVEYKATGKVPTASPSKATAKKTASKPPPPSSSSSGSKKYISAEYIDSNEDSSGEEEEEEGDTGPAPTARKPSQRRGGKGGGEGGGEGDGEGLVSLPSGDEGGSEEDAESTGSEDSEESD